MKFQIMTASFQKKSSLKKIIVLALLEWNGSIWQLVMIMVFMTVHSLNAVLNQETDSDFAIFNSIPSMMIISWLT